MPSVQHEPRRSRPPRSDIVAVAQGKLAPVGADRLVQPSEAGVVRPLPDANGHFGNGLLPSSALFSSENCHLFLCLTQRVHSTYLPTDRRVLAFGNVPVDGRGHAAGTAAAATSEIGIVSPY
jgi:hypothetical protein